MRPPAHVLAEFGVSDEPEPLDGAAWRAGPLALKPLDRSPQEVAWAAELFATIETGDVRVARPLARVVHGWTASEFVEGRPEPGRLKEVIATGERLHAALAHVASPDAIIEARTEPWARCDRAGRGGFS